ncbi:MFS general substrate transporter [Coniophora puteana RWD-64-598 SS2]|uniref:MFS general substrate transporter n=1 Tax=Coniophora puteana (strain RWD-64-598) TaxID=741705 RepID=A0A5M3MCB3_CONPW|nr:MFS general substrate transporter [Coniophora puteana RWD-64-598 SS2]EIW76666.1 MFS general substrate transporter [Coniophora puteana RWD-64-598 SS2]
MSLDRTRSTERTPLVSRTRHGRRSRSVSKERALSPIARILPVAIAWRLASMLPITTTLDIVQKIVCAYWLVRNDPDQIPSGGTLPEELCKNPDISRDLSAVITVLGLLDGICAMLGYSAVSFASQRIGRKPVILALLGIGALGNACIVLVRFLPDNLAAVALILWVLFQSLTNPLVIGYVANMYVIDQVAAETRMSALSTLQGGVTVGAAISMTAGGLITTLSHHNDYVFIIALVILISSAGYVTLFVPESFTVDRRAELARERELARLASSSAALSAPAGDHTLKTHAKAIGHIIGAPIVAVMQPLGQLKPTRDPQTGRKNWRLVLCAAYAFVEIVGEGYASTALILYLTSRYHYTPAQNGYALTTLLISAAVVLTVVIPLLLTYLRPFYARRHASTHTSTSSSDAVATTRIVNAPRYGSTTTEESAGTSAPANANSTEGDDDTVSATSDRLDVHLSIVSVFIDALSYVAFSIANSLAGHLVAIAAIGFGAGRGPAFRSLVVATVDPLKSGEALAAVEMVASVGTFVSTVVLGSISTATISTAPETVFYVHSGIVTLAASILLLVRDRDRWVTPPEEEERQ